MQRTGSEFKEISINKKAKLNTEPDDLKAKMRTTIKIENPLRKNGHKLLQRKLVDSFNRIVKELKHKTLNRREEEN